MQVTSENCYSLSKIEGVSGEVWYLPAYRTLYLRNAKISAEANGSTIYSEIDGLQIELIGINEVTAEDTGVGFVRPMTITGGGTLNVRSLENCAIYMNEVDLTIKHCTVNAIGKKYGIAGSDDYQELLSIERARVTAEGTEKGSIMDIEALSLKDCAILQPDGAKFDETKGGVVLNGALVKSKVVIGSTLPYFFRMGGMQVTSANCDDLSVLPGVSGTVKYDPDTRVLTLKDAKITAGENDSGIEADIEYLKINVIGTNEVYAERSVIWTGGSLEIIGGGILNAKSLDDCAVFVDGTYLYIYNCTVNAIGNLYGIEGKGDTKTRLTINDATVTAEGSKGSLCGFGDVHISSCYIVQPKGADFDKSLKGVAQNGKLVTEKIFILPHYCKLIIAGESVTFDNYEDLSTIDGVSGTVKYDPITKVLTLQDAKISIKGETSAIKSYVDGLTINVIGTNELNADNIGIYLTKPLTITGGGTLNANSQNNEAIYAHSPSLTIDGCTVNAIGKQFGLLGVYEKDSKLTVRNATVAAEGKERGSICEFSALNLIGCNITEPVGAKFDPSWTDVVLNGETVTSKVVIKYDPTAIETPIADNRAAEGIYTLSGVRLSGELKDLPKGIYIVNGKKVVKQ